ncbi:MAG: hypothetical protein AAF755_13130 [Pseudomonadota bacterium]
MSNKKEPVQANAVEIHLNDEDAAAADPLVLTSALRVETRLSQPEPIVEGPVSDEVLFDDLHSFLNGGTDSAGSQASVAAQGPAERVEVPQPSTNISADDASRASAPQTTAQDVAAKIDAFESALDGLGSPKDAASVQDKRDEDDYLEEEVIDEAALREMITEILRQELQGAIGERITRNLRDMIRREIRLLLGMDAATKRDDS